MVLALVLCSLDFVLCSLDFWNFSSDLRACSATYIFLNFFPQPSWLFQVFLLTVEPVLVLFFAFLFQLSSFSLLVLVFFLAFLLPQLFSYFSLIMHRHSELVNTLAVVTALVLAHYLNLGVGVSKNSCSIIELLFVLFPD